MNEQIYIIMRSLTVNGEDYYGDQPSTYALSAEDATELLNKTLGRLREWYSDLEVLGQDDNRLHVRYTNDETGEETEGSYWVVPIRKFNSFAW